MAATRTPDYSYHALRLSLALIYLYFGFLKFFPDVSPAEGLATDTIVYLSGGWLSPKVAILGLAVLEFGLGLALLLNKGMRVAFFLFLFHMLGTFAPLVIFPELTYKVAGLIPTIEGQYILKNIVFVAVAWPIFWPYVVRGPAKSAAHAPDAVTAPATQVAVKQRRASGARRQRRPRRTQVAHPA